MYIDEATSGCIANNELEDINFEEDSARSPSVYLELMENDRESNKQLLEVSNNIQNDYEEHFNELISENIEYCHYNSDDDLDVNELFHENVQSSDEENLKSDLRDWTLRNNISQKTTNELLKLLPKYVPNSSLPTDARTLLHTTHTKIKYISIAGGEYVHFALPNVMTLLMDKYAEAGLTVNNVAFSLNIDGLPISKSSSHCLWPILVSDNILKSVHIIGIYFGANKPTSANHFLEQFINEFTILVQDGFMYGERRINISLSTIICDAPAKSFVLYTKGHNGFSSCSKCTIVGEYLQRTMCFPYSKNFHNNLRTDEDFVQQNDEQYHQGETLLLQIPNIYLVSGVALDYMHLICLDVVKKLLLLLMKGPLTIRIGSTNTNLISEHLIKLKSSVPKEFSRKLRSLSEIKYWKATEFRQFLLYTGPIVLKSVLT